MNKVISQITVETGSENLCEKHMGSIWINGVTYYIFSRVGRVRYALISLYDGNRYREPATTMQDVVGDSTLVCSSAKIIICKE